MPQESATIKSTKGASSVRAVWFLNGLFVFGFGVMQVVPLAVEVAVGSEWLAFFISMSIAMILGGGIMLSSPIRPTSLDVHAAFGFTVTAWLTAAAASAIPFMISSAQLSPTDAFFEAMSGVTTTGATTITNLEDTSPGILLWRAILQWVGGIGIIMTAIALLPALGVGGMQLFLSQQMGSNERVLARASDIAIGVMSVYLGMTILCAMAYNGAGMSPFDAWAHSMTTIASGGYSTHNASAAYFESTVIHWIMITFMILACLPYGTYLVAVHTSPAALWRDEQVRGFLTSLAFIALSLWAILELTTPSVFARASEGSTFENFTATVFSVTAIMTTTGYAVTDYDNWGTFAICAFFLIGMMGACAGSSTCSLKTFRAQIILRSLLRHITIMRRPHAITYVRYNNNIVDDKTIRDVNHFLYLFVAFMLLGAMALTALGLDALTALSGAAAALTNVGPGLGPIIGPAGNYSSLPDAAKWILSAMMLLGRLELLTLLLLLTPAFWRRS